MSYLRQWCAAINEMQSKILSNTRVVRGVHSKTLCWVSLWDWFFCAKSDIRAYKCINQSPYHLRLLYFTITSNHSQSFWYHQPKKLNIKMMSFSIGQLGLYKIQPMTTYSLIAWNHQPVTSNHQQPITTILVYCNSQLLQIRANHWYRQPKKLNIKNDVIFYI